MKNNNLIRPVGLGILSSIVIILITYFINPHFDFKFLVFLFGFSLPPIIILSWMNQYLLKMYQSNSKIGFLLVPVVVFVLILIWIFFKKSTDPILFMLLPGLCGTTIENLIWGRKSNT